MRLLLRPNPPTMRERIVERLPLDRLPLDRIQAVLPFRREPPPSRIRRPAPLVGAGIVGAAFAYLFDPDRGKGRRAKTVDMLAGRLRRTARTAERKRRFIAGKAYGLRQRAAHGIAGVDGGITPDDVTLANKVKSEVLRRPDHDAARIVVNADNGVVQLRGEVDRPEEIERLEREIRMVPGVVGVENMLHIKGSPPVNKLASMEAGRR